MKTQTRTSAPLSQSWQLVDLIGLACRYGLAAVWIFAGSTKLGHPMQLAQTIDAYRIFTQEWSFFLAQLIGPLEIAGGVILLLGIGIRPAARVSLYVLVLFIIGIGQAWYRGLVIDCGCFGEPDLADGGMSYALTIGRDLVLVAMSIWTMRRPFTKFALYP
ncbi:MauE/DoxX family redox-associated membrane protein [Corynebacterium sp. HS2168-gen11]|uniref:MauE/DoxX family redox-associated membrane protein n=1 Tax=Corynebacterium sp. HS2168-gen11 TaxID=2974027 RepID=UPI00216B4D33|nr:MauE/DoxX family redox-associated membrane protein [Corynebacterium sp. HS2168-gen11]MCS4535260.1 DoxX family membrane protein [Corynebacterium sp. HS2168-gen11]